MNLSDFSLLKEDDDTYHIGHPKGRSMVVPKRGLSDKAQKIISKLKRVQNFAEGTPEGTEINSESVQDSPEAIAADAQVGQPVDAQQAPETTQPQVSAQNEVAATTGSPQTATASTAAPEETTPQMPGAAAEADIRKAENSEKAGVAATAKAGRDEQKAYNEAAQAIAQQKSPDQIFQEENKKSQAFYDAHAKDINANRYLENRGVGTRIAQGIALILGGVGGALTHQENPAMKFINNAINNDIEAQKHDQSQNMNLYKANLEATGSHIQAQLQTQNQLLLLAKAKALAATAGAQGAQASAKMAPSILAMDQMITRNNWALSRLKGGPSGTEAQHVNEMQTMAHLDPKLKQEMESKYIPGVGVSRVPITQPQREELSTYNSLGKRLKEAENFQLNEAGVLGTFPGSQANAKAENIRNSLAAELNKLYHLNRLTEIEYHNFTQQIPNPGSFRSAASLTKIHDLQGQLRDREKSVMDSLGVTPFKKAPDDATALAWARQNPGTPEAAAILQANGVK